MRLIICLFALVAVAIAGIWAWLGQPVAMPQTPLAANDKLSCMSYAPFRGSQSPLDGGSTIDRAQIEDDMARLAPVTACVRTYSTELGLDAVPEIAQRYGIKVIQGIWISRTPAKNRTEVDRAVALANKFPEVIQSVVVGNEVLLRGEMAADDLAAIIREVKQRVPVPVTYADVWEFWLRHAQLRDAVDFVTIHILPYWEDVPIPARNAGAHVNEIHHKVAAALPGKDILVGEVGWPSAGRMREGALPSPSAQAQVVQDVIALAKRENYRVNLIEAFDQPWKRRLEGTVGGHWGLLDNATRRPKFAWGEGVSDHPRSPLQAAGGIAFAAVVLAAAGLAARRRNVTPREWAGVAIVALVPGVLIGWMVQAMLVESLGAGGIVRSAALALAALTAAPLVAVALVRGATAPSFAETFEAFGRGGRWLPPLEVALGLCLVLLTAIALQVALGLTFDPRYLDFPFAGITAAVVPFATLALARREVGARPLAEIAAAAVLVLAIIYIVPNEGLGNWQSLWLCGGFAVLAATLLRARGVRG